MANDIEDLTSNETVSQPCRPDLLRNKSDRASEQNGNDPLTMSSDSVTDPAHVKSESQATESAAVLNGCVHRHDETIYSSASNGDEKPSLPTSEPSIIISAESGNNCFSHDFIKLPEKVLESACTDCQNSSRKILTLESACMGDRMQRKSTEKIGNDSEENDDTNAVTELFATTRISNDLPEVPLDALGDEKLQTVGEEPCDLRGSSGECSNGIEYVMYDSEKQMPDIMSLITKDLSEPYSIYTYRYFIHNWPNLCFLALHESKCVGAIVCKLDTHKKIIKRGYIAMLAVAQDYRKRGIGSHLVIRAIKGMVANGCDEVVLETEITNKAALHLYENLGFVRDKRLFRYYLNGVDALRLKLWLK